MENSFLTLSEFKGKGKGVVAKQKIMKGKRFWLFNSQKGTKVLEWDSRICKYTKISDKKTYYSAPKEIQDHCYPISSTEWAVTLSTQHYILKDMFNHSCDPNLGIKYDDGKKMKWVAIRDIKKKEECTFDYSTIFLNEEWDVKVSD